MKITLTLLALFVATFPELTGQNLIGYKDKEIKKYMLENRQDMNFESVTNSKFKYLKYTDSADDQTLLFFLGPDSVCKSIRIICDKGIKANKIKEFDSIYKRGTGYRWTDRRSHKTYLIEMKDDKWACIITIEDLK